MLIGEQWENSALSRTFCSFLGFAVDFLCVLMRHPLASIFTICKMRIQDLKVKMSALKTEAVKDK